MHAMAADLLRSTGKLQLRVTGTSMLPTLWPGDLLSIQSCNIEQVQPGEMVLYGRGNRFVIHRVTSCSVGNGQRFFVTRGDCMPQADQAVEGQQLLGKVQEIRRQGTVVAESKLVWLNRLAGRAMSHCDLLMRIVLRLHQMCHHEPGLDVSMAGTVS